MAWVLPSSFLHVDYASRVRDIISSHFERCLVAHLGQRLFLSEGTEESSVILLADGYSQDARDSDSTRIGLTYAADLSGLARTIESWSDGHLDVPAFSGRATAALLDTKAEEAINVATSAGDVVELGSVAEVRIGIVTGANKFFVIDPATATRYLLPDAALMPIMAKFAFAPGVRVTHEDLERAKYRGQRCLLVNTAYPYEKEPGDPVAVYLSTFPAEARAANKTFKKRALWHRPNDGRTPDAFFPYMHHDGPRLVLNDVRTTSTNTVHRVYFKGRCAEGEDGADTLRKACAVSLLSTFSQLSAEIQGRSYGAGVLKHEPSEAVRISILVPRAVSPSKTESVFEVVDASLRRGCILDARRHADAYVLEALATNERDRIIDILDAALKNARNRRRPLRGIKERDRDGA